MRRSKPVPTRTHFETLEERCLMAGRLSAGVTAGVLHITGTDAADVIEVQQAGKSLTVSGFAKKFKAGGVQRIVIDGGLGNDLIRLAASIRIPAELRGGDGNDTLVGGSAADVLRGGNGNDSLDGAGGIDQLFGDAGDDLLSGLLSDEFLDGGTGNNRVNGQAEQPSTEQVFHSVVGQTTTLGDGGIDFDGDYFIVAHNPGVPTNAPFKIRVDSEILLAQTYTDTIWYIVGRGLDGTRSTTHAAGALVTLIGDSGSTGSQRCGSRISGRLEFFPSQPGTDLTTTGRGPGLVLLSKPRTSPTDQGENGKTISVMTTGWNSDTTQRVEVLIRDASGNGRILLPFSIPNNLPNGVIVSPGEGFFTDVVSHADPTNMHNAGVHDNCAYNFPLSFRVLPNQPSGVVPITIILRQGTDERRFAVDIVVTNPGIAVPAPTAPIGTTTAMRPTFTFTQVAGAARYEIWVEDRSDNNRRVLYDTAITGGSWTAPIALTGGHTYRWYVRAIGRDGKASDWSAGRDFTVSVAAAPAAPTSLGANIVSTSRIDLSWRDVAGENGYTVWINSGSGWRKIIDVAANTTGVMITNLTPGTAYTFAVGSFNSVGTTYAYVNASTPRNTAPTAPGSFRAQVVSSTLVDLFWSDSAGESGYVLEYWDGRQAVRFASAAANATSLRVQNVRGYYIRVGGYNAVGTSYSQWQYVS